MHQCHSGSIHGVTWFNTQLMMIVSRNELIKLPISVYILDMCQEQVLLRRSVREKNVATPLCKRQTIGSFPSVTR